MHRLPAAAGLRLVVVASMLLGLVASPVIQSDQAAAADAPASSSSNVLAVPTVTTDTSFTPLPRGGRSPWDGEFRLDGIDGQSYNAPGTDVKVRAMSSNAFFVDEVWLVYPRVQYLFNNKDVPDIGGAFDEIQFSNWIDVGKFPPGTELIFGVKTGVGIDDKCQDRVNGDGSVDRHHCYKVTQDPSWVPLAPDPLRDCTLSDEDCRNKAWPSLTPDGRTIFYTGPGLRNIKDDSPHGRFQYLTNTRKDGTGEELTNTALFGLEDVGAPKAGCPGADELDLLFTTTQIEVSDAVQTVGLSRVTGLSVGQRISIYQPFQRETVTLTAVNALASTVTALFDNPDNKPYPADTNWAPEGCDWHPDFQDAGIVVWPALAATCQSTVVKDRVEIVGQAGYGTVKLRDSTQASEFPQTFQPGDLISFTVNLAAPPSVSGASPSWSINLNGQALMRITDPTRADDDPNKSIDAGICYDPEFPPPPVISAIQGSVACDAGWDFTISGINADNPAPPSIRVNWTNDQVPPADEAATIPLTSIDAGGVAHYQSDLHTSLTVVAATTTAPSVTWIGAFTLEKGPCPELQSADVTLACATGLDIWDFTITDTTQAQAPAQIQVTWADGSTADLPLSSAVTGGVARYTSTEHLDQRVSSATASIQGAWSGQFKVNGVACPASRSLSLTAIPPCAEGTTEWDFTISGLTTAPAPESILVKWGDLAAEAVARTSFDGTSGLAHYTTAAHTGDGYLAVTSVSAVVAFASQADADAYAGVLAAPGVPCAPPPPPDDPKVHVKRSTLSCDGHDDDASEWHFVITQIDLADAPLEIDVTWANGDVESVAIWKYTGHTAHYLTTSNLDSPVVDATASISELWSGQFNLSHGPCVRTFGEPSAPPPASPTPTPTPGPPCVDRSLSTSRSGGASRGSGTGSSCSSGDDDQDESGDEPDPLPSDGASDNGSNDEPDPSPSPSPSPSPAPGGSDNGSDDGDEGDVASDEGDVGGNSGDDDPGTATGDGDDQASDDGDDKHGDDKHAGDINDSDDGDESWRRRGPR